ncbi:hypothetical protein Cgig2_012450 [Carnegiea gigantea]|uniref:Uncharacterized protein n=1 Tax=Carnegiea gigantea TaxID=171969 RepID=A0A9Q1KMY1_9CARY|nr:hypothetical protein Cgig2_012450 [Carnegiea gigantea]
MATTACFMIKEDAAQQHQFILHAALDIVQDISWTTSAMFLKAIDRFNDLVVSVYVTAAYVCMVGAPAAAARGVIFRRWFGHLMEFRARVAVDLKFTVGRTKPRFFSTLWESRYGVIKICLNSQIVCDTNPNQNRPIHLGKNSTLPYHRCLNYFSTSTCKKIPLKRILKGNRANDKCGQKGQACFDKHFSLNHRWHASVEEEPVKYVVLIEAQDLPKSMLLPENYGDKI